MHSLTIPVAQACGLGGVILLEKCLVIQYDGIGCLSHSLPKAVVA